MKNTSILLGNHFDAFVNSPISTGRYKNVSEVISAGLRLLEDEESKIIALRSSIHKGLGNPRVDDFDFDEHLKSLKKRKIGYCCFQASSHRRLKQYLKLHH